MIRITLDKFSELAGGELRSAGPVPTVRGVSTDSRMIFPGALFVALRGQHTDGHGFLAMAFENGAAAALVARSSLAEVATDPGWPLVVVDSPLVALQEVAAWYRRQSLGSVLAITGSNGKTIVKDALVAQLATRSVATSPGSYNSQLGVPLSVLGARAGAELGVFEAGVSAPGDMERLRHVLAPRYGILTNIGMAHLASMGDRETIAREKMSLFKPLPEDGWVLLPAGEPLIAPYAQALVCRVFEMGSAEGLPRVLRRWFDRDHQALELLFPSGARFNVRLHTRSPDIAADLMISASAACLLGVEEEDIANALDGFEPPPTRLEIWRSQDGVTLVNDACSSDPISVRAALRTAVSSAPHEGKKVFVFGGMRELGEQSESLHTQVGVLAAEKGFSHLFLVGKDDLTPVATAFRRVNPGAHVVEVRDPGELEAKLRPLLGWGDTVLFKGPRNAGVGQAAKELSGSMAQRLLTVDLGAVQENVSQFRRRCGPEVEVLAMVKALSYGTNVGRLAYWMSKVGVRHIGVSSTSEAVDIRRLGVHESIYVFLADREDKERLLRYRLTPVIYSADLAQVLADYVSSAGGSLDVHLKVDTGMHRLGVPPETAVEVAQRIRDSRVLKLRGVCTHFASADDPQADPLTHRQIAVFDRVLEELRDAGFSGLAVHAANTSAAARFPQARYNMVRVGLGLYGLYPSAAVKRAIDLQLAVSLTSRITEVRHYEAGDGIGYHHTYAAQRPMRAGIVPCGYDDGVPWSLSNRGWVLIHGRKAPMVGRICMDQLQVDITDLPEAGVGTEVLFYGTRSGHTSRPEEVASLAGTMTHELLVRLGRRVQRVYVEP